MKINKFLLTSLLFMVFSSKAQITKNYWMMGGSGSFWYNKETRGGTTTGNAIGFNVHPDIGYFLIDKLALGLSGDFNHTFPNKYVKADHLYSVSPFVRYYFLEKDKAINLFSEVSYDVIRATRSNFKSDVLNVKGGTVFFLNNSVGLEVALNYSKRNINQDHGRSVFLDIGFQIHLERK